MSLAAVLALCLTSGQLPPPGAPRASPAASETAKLYFLAGDVLKAQEWARRGLRKEPKRCKAQLRLLAEYAWLVGRMDEFTGEQARQFFELDRALSPTVRGKLTEKAWERYVTKPLALARARGPASGRELVERVRFVDPSNAEAGALLADWARGSADAGLDAGR